MNNIIDDGDEARTHDYNAGWDDGWEGGVQNTEINNSVVTILAAVGIASIIYITLKIALLWFSLSV